MNNILKSIDKHLKMFYNKIKQTNKYKNNIKQGEQKMLYTEFLVGTKAVENSNTYEQYEAIEKIYNVCEDMTKEEAYKLWKQTYGKQQKLDRERTIKKIKAMSEYYDNDEALETPDKIKIRRELFQVGVSLTKTNEFQMGFNAELTTPDNVTYRLEKFREINSHRQMKLLIKYEGKTYETNLLYGFGDFRIKYA
jgi:hypothetical protein